MFENLIVRGEKKNLFLDKDDLGGLCDEVYECWKLNNDGFWL